MRPPLRYSAWWRFQVSASAENIEICVNQSNGKIKGVNLGSWRTAQVELPTEIDWVSIGPTGPTGMRRRGRQSRTAGTQGPQGYPGIRDLRVHRERRDRKVLRARRSDRTYWARQASWVRMESVDRPVWSGTLDRPDRLAHPEIAEPNISVFTGGSMGTLGGLFNVDLSGNNSVGNPGTILIMGPGNGSDTSQATEVPMSEDGIARRLFVNVDNDPGTQMNNGLPSTFWFFLCNGNNFPSNCGLVCSITAPDTTCSDLTGSQVYNVTITPPPGNGGQPVPNPDEMSLWAYADYPGANHASVKWSVTYDHGAGLIIP